MKTINVTFEDSEIEEIEWAKDKWKVWLKKDKVTWREFIVLCAKETGMRE